MKYCALALILLFPVVLHASSPQVDVVCYRADITIDPQQSSIEATVDILLTNRAEIDLYCIPLDLVGLTVLSVEVDNVGVPWTHDFGSLQVFPDVPIRLGDTVSVRVIYGGMPQNHNGSGPVFGEVSYCLPQSRDLDYLCTTSHWLPMNNLINDKARYDLTFDVAEGLTAASIGRLEFSETLDGRSRYRWVEDVPTPPHAVLWAVADYTRIQEVIGGVPAEYYVLQRDADKAEEYFSTIPDMVHLYTDLLGSWPVEKIGFCWVPNGTVQGQGMITFNTTNWNITAGAAEAHELAHHWFGNSLTPADIRENWLSEGFATYLAWMYRVERDDEEGLDAVARHFVASYRDQVAVSEGVIPLYNFRSSIEDNAPATIHEKGALVLNMLRHVMGEEHFRSGFRAYVEQYAGQAVTSYAFEQAMERHSIVPLADFFEQWVYRAGWPEYAVTRFCEEPDGPFKLCLHQTQGAKEWPYFSMPVDIDLYMVTGDTLRVTRQAQAVEHDMIVVDEVQDRNVIGYTFDPDGWLLKDIVATSAVEPMPSKTSALVLQPLYPQPLTATSSRGTLPFSLERAGNVRAELRDMLGRVHRVLADRWYPAGAHQLQVDAAGLANGCYHVMLQTGNDAAHSNLLLR